MLFSKFICATFIMHSTFDFLHRIDFALWTEVNEIASVSMSQESIIHNDTAQSNQRGLSVMKGERGMSIQILNFLAPGVPSSLQCMHETRPYFPQDSVRFLSGCIAHPIRFYGVRFYPTVLQDS